jgi:hypothetical protein
MFLLFYLFLQEESAFLPKYRKNSVLRGCVAVACCVLRVACCVLRVACCAFVTNKDTQHT